MKNILQYSILFIFIGLSYSIYSQQLYPYRVGDKWGYSDSKGKIIIKPKFNSAGFFFSNLKITSPIACVKKGKKYIFINKKGKKVIKEKFDKAYGFNSYTSYSRVTKNGKEYCIDKNGDKTRCITYCSGPRSIMSYFHKYSKNGKIGVYYFKPILTPQGKDSVEKVVLPAIWDSFYENNYGFAIVEQDGKFGIINKKFELIVSYKYDKILTTQSNRKSGQFKIFEDGKWGLLNRQGKMLIEPKYYKIDFFNRNVTKAWLDNNFWFYIDKKGFEFYEN